MVDLTQLSDAELAAWYSKRARGSKATASSVTPALVSISRNVGTEASTRNNLAVNYSKSNSN